MRKVIYTAIKQTLLSIKDSNNNPVIKHVDLWNQQTVLPEEEQPFATPAVFIEFMQIQWNPLAQGIREATVQIALHVVTDSRVGAWSDVLNVFVLMDDINKALHRLSTVDGNYTMDSLTLIQSDTDHDFDELQNNIETYSCHVTDASASTRSYLPSHGVSLDVSAQVQG
ncbi:MAG: hypothetical protein MJZ84_07425 [Paludibacteraceae bacterium]|nr:hypothetical protein [Paludibacteraceae bacterium]